MLGWIMFRSPDIGYAAGYLGALVRPGLDLPGAIALELDPIAIVALVGGAASALLPGTWVTGRRLESDPQPLVEVLRLGAVVIALPVAIVSLVASGFSPFLYFQF